MASSVEMPSHSSTVASCRYLAVSSSGQAARRMLPSNRLGRDGAANGRNAPAGLRHPPPPNRTCPFQGIRLSIRWARPMYREHRLFRHLRRVRTSLLRRNSLRSTPIRLPSFAMRPAFPTSDYYEGSATRPALAEGWPTPLPESRSRFPSSPRLRLRAVLGSASTPGTARCRARHRETPVDWSSVSLS